MEKPSGKTIPPHLFFELFREQVEILKVIFYGNVFVNQYIGRMNRDSSSRHLNMKLEKEKIKTKFPQARVIKYTKFFRKLYSYLRDLLQYFSIDGDLSR